MILAGHQPNYLPYIGFFHKAMICDKFVLVDHTQYEKKSWQNRNRIRTQNGWIWLTVPILSKGEYYQKVSEAKINNSIDWKSKHWKSIYFNYKNALFFEDYKVFFEDLFKKEWYWLADLNEAIIRYFFAELRIRASIVKSSEFKPEGNKTDLLIDMCTKLGIDTFLSGSGGRSYVDLSKFERHGLCHFYQDFHHPTYHQQFDPFIFNMSVIDLMFNLGSKRSREIISNCGGITSV